MSPRRQRRLLCEARSALGSGRLWVLELRGADACGRRDRLEQAGVSRVAHRRRFVAERRPRGSDRPGGGVRCAERDRSALYAHSCRSARQLPWRVAAHGGCSSRVRDSFESLWGDRDGGEPATDTGRPLRGVAGRHQIARTRRVDGQRASRADMRSPQRFGPGDPPTASIRRFLRLPASPLPDSGAARRPIRIRARRCR